MKDVVTIGIPEQLLEKFVTADAIPSEFALPAEVHQKEYLSNGEMKTWDGKTQLVYSPVCIKTPNGL